MLPLRTRSALLLALLQAPRAAGRGAIASATAQCRGVTEDPAGCVVFGTAAAASVRPVNVEPAGRAVEGNCTGAWQFGPPSPNTLEPCVCDPHSFGCPTVDPAFDLSRVRFAGSFLSGMVLQRGPSSASAVFGTASPGATVQLHAQGPGGWTFSAKATASAAKAAEEHGTWKVLLPPRPASVGGYSITAKCATCANSTAQTLSDVSFGDVWFCSGQSVPFPPHAAHPPLPPAPPRARHSRCAATCAPAPSPVAPPL